MSATTISSQPSKGTTSSQEDDVPELSFERIVTNKSLPPCALSDFMDYLVYVEEKAENLQFFLWYCDYVERWSKLLPRQKSLSPVWNPTRETSRMGTMARPRASVHQRSDSDKLAKIISIMERQSQDITQEAVECCEHQGKTEPGVEEDELPASECPCHIVPRSDWQPYTIQPNRDEVTKVVRHYIADGAPRKLDIFPQEQAACLRSVQSTTHPSALLPAFLAAETVLRTQSHPNFAKWSFHNSNSPRLTFVKAIAILIALLGLALDIVFILSSASHFVRIICLSFWWPALTALFSAFSGICLVLHCKGVRALRPWEQFPYLEAFDHKNDSTTSINSIDDLEKGSRCSTESCPKVGFSRLDPLRKASLQAFGPNNSFDGEPWVEQYAKKPVFRKIFEPTVLSQNQGLRILQDRVVFKTMAAAGAVSTVLTVASVFVPSANLF